ncbi:hypothetical protein, partial [Escherichia coli]
MCGLNPATRTSIRRFCLTTFSDLHLCSAWPARWRIRGRMEAAPFDAPDV